MPSIAALLADRSRAAGTPINVPTISTAASACIHRPVPVDSPTDTRARRQCQWRWRFGSRCRIVDHRFSGSPLMDTIENPQQLRQLYGEPSERAVKKQLTRFERHSRNFIALSPFLVIASADPSGRCDASPKGDMPGFVRVVDDTTLLIPDRLGNNRVDTLGNLLRSPGVGLIFFVPGLNETLRVNGRAQVATD